MNMRFNSTSVGQIIYGSSSLVNMLGYTFMEFLNVTTADFIHPDDFTAYVANTNKLMQHPEESIDYCYRLQHKNGQSILCEGTMTNMLQEPGINALISSLKKAGEKNILANRTFKANYH